MEQTAVERGEDILEHFGVKGMRWGVRNEIRREDKARLEGVVDILETGGPKLERSDKKFIKQTIAKDTRYNKAYEAANKRFNEGELEKFNNRPEFKKMPRIIKSDSPALKKYLRALEKHTAKIMNEEFEKIYGSRFSPSGNVEVKFFGNPKATTQPYFVDPAIGFAKTKVKHAAMVSDTITVPVILTFDETGRVARMRIANDNEEGIPLSHSSFSDDEDGDILEHFGIKGMKWGIRKKRSTLSKKPKTDNAPVINLGGSKVGNERTRFKKSPKRLTNEELIDRIKRMEMEKRYNDLNKKDVAKGRSVANGILASVGRELTTKVLKAMGMAALKATLPGPVARELGGGGKKGKDKDKNKDKELKALREDMADLKKLLKQQKP